MILNSTVGQPDFREVKYIVNNYNGPLYLLQDPES